MGIDEIRLQLKNEKIMRQLDEAKGDIETTITYTKAALDKEISDAKVTLDNELSDADDQTQSQRMLLGRWPGTPQNSQDVALALGSCESSAVHDILHV